MKRVLACALWAVACGPGSSVPAGGGEGSESTHASSTSGGGGSTGDPEVCFEEVRYVLLDGLRCGSVAAGDVEADSDDDLLALPGGGFIADPTELPLSTFAGGAEGPGPAEVHCCIEMSPRGAALVDLNGDGRADPIVQTSREWWRGDIGGFDLTVEKLIRGPAGGYVSQQLLTRNIPSAGTAVAVGDFLPGTPSIAVSSGSLLLAFRAEGITLVPVEPSLDLGDAIRQLATVDLDGIMGDDLVASLDTSLVALRNRGDATFEIAYTAPAPIAAFELHAADLDGDGASELVLGSREAIALVHLDGFTPGPALPEGLLPPLALADLDGDAVPDLLASSENAIVVAAGLGDGSFASPTPLVAAEPRIADLELGDLNADGITDVVVCDGAGVLVAFGPAP